MKRLLYVAALSSALACRKEHKPRGMENPDMVEYEQPEIVRQKPNGSILRTINATRSRFPNIKDSNTHWIYYRYAVNKKTGKGKFDTCYWVDPNQPLLPKDRQIPIPEEIRERFNCIDPLTGK